MQDMSPASFFDLSHTLAAPLFDDCEVPWLVLPRLKQFILELGKTLDSALYDNPAPDIWIAKTATVAPTASISGPTVICDGAEIRHCAYIRGSVIVGCGSVVGNSCEVKNSIIFDSVQVPHFNYVGDSILGYHAHMGAGAVTSNIKSDRTSVTVRDGESRIETGMRKLGAILGDNVEIGCNSVLNPGTVIGRGSRVYPLSNVRGIVPPDSIFKAEGVVVPIQK
ncbi:MAG: UDP-N-acetylglucosamine pyrophosphorylase [Clostridia bacterium]|nr:UDP-N-acetylglucosamine pyrophosphorylase [Clostridia bacterium]